MTNDARWRLKQRTTKILDVAYDRIEKIILENKTHRLSSNILTGRISYVLSNASTSIDDAIDRIVR